MKKKKSNNPQHFDNREKVEILSLGDDVEVWFTYTGVTVSPCSYAWGLYRIDQEASEAAALQHVQGVDGGATWWAHIVLQLARVLLRVQQHLCCSLK